MIYIKCDICNLELITNGAILISPPDNDRLNITYNICKECYLKLNKFLLDITVKNTLERLYDSKQEVYNTSKIRE